MSRSLLFLSAGLHLSAVVLALRMVWPARHRWRWIPVLVAMVLQGIQGMIAAGHSPSSGWLSLAISASLCVGILGLTKHPRQRGRAPMPPVDPARFGESVVEIADAWIIAVDLQDRVTLWNHAAERISGYRRDEVLGRSDIWERLFPEEDYRAGIMVQGGADEVAGEREATIRTRGGECRTVSWHITALKDDAGRISARVISGRDLTKRRRAEEALKEREARYRSSHDLLRSVLESSPDVSTFALDRDCRYLTFNAKHKEGIKALWGKQISVGASMLDIIESPRHRGVARQLFDRALSGESFNLQLSYGDQLPVRGCWHHFYAPIRSRGGEIIGLTCHALDITERRQAEEALRTNKATLDLALRSAQMGVWSWDDQNKRFHFDEQICQLLGIDMAAFRGTMEEFLRSIEPKDRAVIAEAWAGSMKGNHPFEVETSARWRDGSVHTIQARGQLMRDEAGQPLRIIGTLWDITERKRLEGAVQQSQARFRDAFVNAPFPIAIHAEDGELLALNEAWTLASGYTPEDIPTMRSWVEKAYPGQEQIVMAHNETLYHATQQVVEGEYLIRTKGNEHRVWNYTSTPLERLPDGRRTVFTIARDVTEQRTAQAELKASEEKYRGLFEAMQEGFVLYEIITDAEGRPADYRFLEVNPAFEVLTGLPREKWIGRTLLELNLQPEFEWMAAFDTVAFSRTSVQVERYSAFRRRWYRMFAYPFKPMQVAILAEDITERKQAEASLRESLQRNKALLEANPDLMFVFSADGRIIDAKVEPTDDLYVPRDAFMGKHLGEVLPPDTAQLALDNLAKARLTGSSVHFAYALEMHGEPRHYEARLVPCGNDTFLGVVRDITEGKRAREERRRLRAQLQQAQKLESLGRLAGGVAHDMNNVLGAILAISSFNLEIQPPDSPTYRYFDTISRAATRGGEMVKSLLSLARQSPADKSELDMNAILREEVSLLERTTLAQVRLEMDLATSLRPIRGDANALAHAFMNLCVNAVDAMPENGTLALRTRDLGEDGIEVQVEDTGCGMPKDVLERAMDPFFTTKEYGKGTGLGLSMVYSTVKAHQGQMELRSEPGRGTCVTLRFPACEAPRRPAKPAAAPLPGYPHRRLSVLVVDDDELIQNSMGELLEVKGHRTTSAFTGEEALARLEAGLQPDVVILDLNMPGLGGAGTLPRLRALRPDVPILLATGRPDQTALDLVEAHPGVTMLPKPFNLKELQAHFECLVR